MKTMIATIKGQTVPYTATSLWEQRMISDVHPKPIKSYFPDIGRGNIEHDTVSAKIANKNLLNCAKKSVWERFLGWLDV